MPSEFNASDEGSRVVDGNSSHSLMHVLAALGSKGAGSCTSEEFAANKDRSEQRARATAPNSDAGEMLSCRVESETDEEIGSPRHLEQPEVAVRRRGRRSGRQHRKPRRRRHSRAFVKSCCGGEADKAATARPDPTDLQEPDLPRRGISRASALESYKKAR